MTLDFELPSFFRDPHKFVPGNLDHFFEDVPSVVAAAIFEAISDDVPADPSIPLIYLRNNRLPRFVVAWFMAAMPTEGRRLGKSTRFFRALHGIEMFREYVLYPPENIPEFILAGAGAVPPDHFLSGFGGMPTTDEMARGEADKSSEEESGGEGEKEGSDLNNAFVEEDDEKKNWEEIKFYLCELCFAYLFCPFWKSNV